MAKSSKNTILWVLVVLGLVTGGAIAINGYNTLKTAENLMFSPIPKDIIWDGIKGGAIKFRLRFSITNPTNNVLQLKNVFLDVAFEGVGTIAEIRATQGLASLNPNSTTNLTIPVEIPLTQFALKFGVAAYNFITGGNIPSKATIKGSITANEFTTKIEQTIPLTKA